MITTTYDELFTFENICKAHFRGRKCKRDKRPLIRFEMEMLYHLYNLFKELADGKFKLSKYQYFTVAEPKVREIQTQPYVKRIVQHLLCDDILAPYFTANSIMDNCVCQKGKGEHFALNRFETMLRKHIDKRGTGGYFIKCDVLKYFPSIPHKRLKELFCNEIADEKLRNLVEYIIDSYTASKEFLDKYGIPSIEGETGTGRGIPIGNQTSQIFGMFYLDKLDRVVKEQLRIKVYSRYMDDAVMAVATKEEAQATIEILKEVVSSLGLYVNDKTQIFPLTNGVTYLGFKFTVTRDGKIIKTVKKRTRNRFKSRAKLLKKAYYEGYIDSERVRNTVSAFHGHLAHGDCHNFEKELRKKLAPCMYTPGEIIKIKKWKW